MSSTLPTNVHLLSSAREVHCNYVVEELQLRNAVFERTKLNDKGNEETRVNQLTSILKSVVCPNEIEESVNVSTKENEIHEHFE